MPVPAPASAEAGDRVRVLSAGGARLVPWRASAPLPAPSGARFAPGLPVEVPDPAPDGAPDAGVGAEIVAAMPPVPDWHGMPSLDERAFPVVVLVMLGVFVLITGRGDRRDPKLVRADLDARGREVGFS